MATFTYSGYAFTKMLRNTFLDYGFERAYYFFSESLPDTSIDILLAILKGEKKFFGNTEYTLIDDDDPEYLNAVTVQHGAIYRENTLYYKPLYMILGTMSENMMAYLFAIQYTWQEKKIVCAQDTYIVEQCKDVPFFITPYKNLDEAIRRAKEADSLCYLPYMEFRRRILEEGEGRLNADIRKLLENIAVEHELAKTRQSYTTQDVQVSVNEPVYEPLNIEYEPEILALQKKILEQAGERMLTIPYRYRNETKYIRVPEMPFSRWAMGALAQEFYNIFPWKNVAPRGYKIPNDNSDHTDWLIGAGLYSPRYYLDCAAHPEMKAIQAGVWQYAFDLSQKIRKKYRHA